MGDKLSLLPDHVVPPRAVERAVRLSYAQAMLSAIYAAFTGGMFIIGYALKLGATDAQIGLMGTIPMFAVGVQLVSSTLVERGISRRRMTITAAVMSVLGWLLIILLPYVTTHASEEFKIGALIALITLLTLFAYMAGNARASWIGDLIPPRRRGAFFGRITMYGGIIGTVFALAAGLFLDHAVKNMGIPGFSWIFLCGIFFGLLNAILFIPQSDVPLKKHESGGKPVRLIRETLRNKSLIVVMFYWLLWSMQGIAAPFYATYMLRDLDMPYFGVALTTAVATLSVLASGPFWGRVIDRYGCKPVIIACTTFLIPVPLAWIWLTNAQAVYMVICPMNLPIGFATGGIGIALTTLVYKVTPDSGRSVQFAVFGIIVTLIAAPMPTIGGHLPHWLKGLGMHADLRCTFYASVVFILAAALVARLIKEPDARHTRELVSNLHVHIRSPKTLERIGREGNAECGMRNAE